MIEHFEGFRQMRDTSKSRHAAPKEEDTRSQYRQLFSNTALGHMEVQISSNVEVEKMLLDGRIKKYWMRSRMHNCVPKECDLPKSCRKDDVYYIW